MIFRKDAQTAQKRITDVLALAVPDPKDKSNFMAPMLKDIPN